MFIVGWVSVAFAGERLDRAFDRVGATEAQRTEVLARLDQARESLRAMREEGVALREEIRGVLFAPELDRKALEGLRVQWLDWMDRASAAGFDVAADVVEVFTPEQRAELRELREEAIADRWARWSAQE
ncbi:MAG: Spy/CpxP family protein refolding chaperone [Myxococcota bacterium]